MVIFLTSELGENYMDDASVRHPQAINDRNGLRSNLRRFVPADCTGVIMASDPDSYENNDSVRDIMLESFRMSGIPVNTLVVCDGRNCDSAGILVSNAGLVVMAGGHVPTENSFYEKIGLCGIMRNYDGVVIGISAGTMNCAQTVYALPELEGEAVNPDYRRYIKGLGLTNINVLPHLQFMRSVVLDGLRVVEDIALADSRIRPFYGLNDGSYILINGGVNTLYGEAYYFADGHEMRVCKIGESLVIK